MLSVFLIQGPVDKYLYSSVIRSRAVYQAGQKGRHLGKWDETASGIVFLLSGKLDQVVCSRLVTESKAYMFQVGSWESYNELRPLLLLYTHCCTITLAALTVLLVILKLTLSLW